ncbi:MAG: hypothetical protein ACYC0F_05060 [Rhodanobacter sp.]
MGSSKKQTVGYWYDWAMHFGWCKGPVDAFLEFRGGDKTAWQGRLTASGRITINKPNLWGGEDSTSGGTGGIVGEMDVMFGEADQAPNDYLAATFGPQQTGHRGKLTTVFRGGKFGAFVANPKPVSAKVERILKDWQDDTPWYPATAVINMGDVDSMPASWTEGGFSVHTIGQAVDAGTSFPGSNEYTAQLADFYNLPYDASIGSASQWRYFWRSNESGLLYSKRIEQGANNSNVPMVQALISRGWMPDRTALVQYWTLSTLAMTVYTIGAVSPPPAAPAGYGWTEADESPMTTIRGTVRVWQGVLITAGPAPLHAMNAAHIVYDSLTHADMQGEPVGAISDASFRAAANKLYSEAFGLCTEYDSSQETPKQFQQRICNVIGASLSQSRVDGLYYLDLIRGDYDLGSLPIIGEDDVISFSQDPSVITETGNKLSAEWFDPLAKEMRTTAPMFSMGNVRSAGRVIPSETRKYPEIPIESLALRVVSRDLKSTAVPLSKFDLGTRATLRGLRPGMNARLQLPSEGIADMVVVTGSVAHGTATKGDMKIVAVQNIYSMPSTVYVSPQDGMWVAPDTTATASPHQRALESPYVELASSLNTADLAALPVDAGYLLTVASPAAAGAGYVIDTAAPGEDYTDRGTGDWCPTATIVQAAGYADTAFTLADGALLDRVAVGSWALWDDEIVRVDAIDVSAGTLTLGRGCADTVPAGDHGADSRIYFCGDWVGSDQREYVGGDVVRAKLLTRTATDQLDLDIATELTTTFGERQVRPYPPGNLTINGDIYPATVSASITLTWSHRDRLIAADQLIDTNQTDLGPEAGTTYTVRTYLGGVLNSTTTGITGATHTPTSPGSGLVRIEIDAVRDGYVSWQPLTATFDFSVIEPRITEDGIERITEAGETRILE